MLRAHLGPDLCSFLGVHHAHVFEMLKGVLSVFLLRTDILLQHVEHMMRLWGKPKEQEFQVGWKHHSFHWHSVQGFHDVQTPQVSL